MTGTARPLSLAAIILAAMACVPAEGPAPATPFGSPGGDLKVAPSPGEPPASPAPAAPASEKSWPFGPAPSAEATKAQLDRLAADQGPIRSNWTPPGKGERYGHAEALIGAPYEVVKARLLDFAHYKELAGPRFKKVSVVDKQGGFTDLYFQLPIMKGLVTIWYVTRFGTARSVAGLGDVIEGTFVKGNVKDMQIVFTLRPAPDPKGTVVVCDLNLAVSIPAPQDAIDEELRDACGDALNAVRARTTAQRD